MELIREILASHASGISRGGLLAWARLRGDPQMTDEQLETILVELADEVVDVQGFLYLRQHAPAGSLPASWPAADAGPPAAAPWQSPGAAPGEPAPSAEAPPWTSAVGTGAPPPAASGWPPSDGSARPPSDAAGWPPSDGSTWTTPGSADGEPATWTPPAQAPSQRRSMVFAAISVGVFVAISMAVSFVVRDGDDPANPAVPTPTAGAVIDANTLRAGDCLILPSEDEFDDVRRLACTDPHDAEIFFVGSHPDGPYPSDEAFETYVDAQCLPSFEAYTGSDYYEQEVLDIGWFTPTTSGWEEGDRDVLCHLFLVGGSRTTRTWRGGNP